MARSQAQISAIASARYETATLGATATAGNALLLSIASLNTSGNLIALPKAKELGDDWIQIFGVADTGNTVAIGLYLLPEALGTETQVAFPLHNVSTVCIAQLSELPASGGVPNVHGTAATTASSGNVTSQVTGTATASGACVAFGISAKDATAAQTCVWTTGTERFDAGNTTGALSGFARDVGGAGSVSDTATWSGAGDGTCSGIVLLNNVTLTGAVYGTPVSDNAGNTTPIAMRQAAFLPAPATAGNLLLLFWVNDGNQAAMPVPAGFSAIHDMLETANTQISMRSFYKWATGGEQDVCVDLDSAIGGRVWLQEITGWGGAPTLGASVTSASSSGPVETIQPGSITVTSADVFSAYCKDNSGGQTATSPTSPWGLFQDSQVCLVAHAWQFDVTGSFNPTFDGSGGAEDSIAVQFSFVDVVTRSQTIPVEGLSPAIADVLFGLESLAASGSEVSSAALLSVESLQQISATLQPGVEALSETSTTLASSFEALASTSRSEASALEFLGSVLAGTALQIEALAAAENINASAVLSIEAVSSVAVAQAQNVSALAAASRASAAEFEALASVAASPTAHLESLAAAGLVLAEAALPIETLSIAVNAQQIALEHFAPAFATVATALETLLSVTRDTPAGFESLATAVRSYDLPWESLSNISAVQREISVHVETLASAAASSRTAIESMRAALRAPFRLILISAESAVRFEQITVESDL